MADNASKVEAAITLMEGALLLLDKAGEAVAAARLQHAIDMLGGSPDHVIHLFPFDAE